MGDEEAIRQRLRHMPTDQLRAKLRNGEADVRLKQLIRAELASRHSLLPEESWTTTGREAPREADPSAPQVPTQPPPIPAAHAASTFSDVRPTDMHALSIPGWVWPVVFMVALLVCGSFGTQGRNQADNGLLYGVIVMQAGAITGVLAIMASFVRSATVWGLLGRLVMLLVVLVVIAFLSFCSSFVRHGWGGG